MPHIFTLFPSNKIVLFQLFRWLKQVTLFGPIECMNIKSTKWNHLNLYFFSKEEEYQAASRIQASFRGYQVRKNNTNKEAS